MGSKNHDTLHVNCQAEDKRRWQLTARAHRMSLPDWVSARLNESVIDTSPAWAEGLSERAVICLLGGDFGSFEQVLGAWHMGFDFASLSNAGPSIRAEIEKWLNV